MTTIITIKGVDYSGLGLGNVRIPHYSDLVDARFFGSAYGSVNEAKISTNLFSKVSGSDPELSEYYASLPKTTQLDTGFVMSGNFTSFLVVANDLLAGGLPTINYLRNGNLGGGGSRILSCVANGTNSSSFNFRDTSSSAVVTLSGIPNHKPFVLVQRNNIADSARFLDVFSGSVTTKQTGPVLTTTGGNVLNSQKMLGGDPDAGQAAYVIGVRHFHYSRFSRALSDAEVIDVVNYLRDFYRVKAGLIL